MRNENYILGGGPAGLIAAFYNPDYKIIDKNPMGQLNLPFVPGPRILKVDEYSKRFIERLHIPYFIKTIHVGYSHDGINVVDEADKTFKQNYSQITRGTTKIEDSFLSSGENQIEVFASDNGDDLYYKVFAILTDQLKDRIIAANVSDINTKERLIGLDRTEFLYDNVISTLNINILTKLLGLQDLGLVALKKHFVQCSYNNPHDIELAKKYHYVYSTDGQESTTFKPYTRKTYFKDYIVYEMLKPFEQNAPDPQHRFMPDYIDLSHIQGNKVLKVLNNIPIQINNSIDFRNIQGIELVGRFAQWNHSIKANEIIARYERQISRNI